MKRVLFPLVLLMLASPPRAQAQVLWQGGDEYVPVNTTKATLVYVTDTQPCRQAGSVVPCGPPQWNIAPNQWWTIQPWWKLNVPANAVALRVRAFVGTSGAYRDAADPDPVDYCSGWLTTRPIGSTQPAGGYNAVWAASAVPGEPIQRADRPHGQGVWAVANGEREGSSTWNIPLIDQVTGLPVGAFEFFWHTEDERCSSIVLLELDSYRLPKGATPGFVIQGQRFW
jgi:hypothetical protein